jgi:hypothetical protein
MTIFSYYTISFLYNMNTFYTINHFFINKSINISVDKSPMIIYYLLYLAGKLSSQKLSKLKNNYMVQKVHSKIFRRRQTKLTTEL